MTYLIMLPQSAYVNLIFTGLHGLNIFGFVMLTKVNAEKRGKLPDL
jgi:hypothetical protein